MDPGSSHEDEFEAYLRQRKRLRPPSSQAEPPAELDRIILANARQAIKSPDPVPVYRAPGWALSAGLLAILVLSCALFFHLGARSARSAATAPGNSTQNAAAAATSPAAAGPAASPGVAVPTVPPGPGHLADHAVTPWPEPAQSAPPEHSAAAPPRSHDLDRESRRLRDGVPERAGAGGPPAAAGPGQ